MAKVDLHFVNGSQPALSADNMNTIVDGINENYDDIGTLFNRMEGLETVDRVAREQIARVDSKTTAALSNLSERITGVDTELQEVNSSLSESITNNSKRIDNLVVSGGDSPVEVIDAHVGADNTTYTTLKGRLDSEYKKLTANTFDLADFALKSVCPNNKLIYDDRHIPSTMVYIPKMRICDVLSSTSTDVLPAFIVNGKEIDGFWFGKYNTKHIDGRAYSQPSVDPSVSANLDTFVTRAKATGTGFHEVTNAEWACIALWCHKHGCEPYGNNNYGKDLRENGYKAIPSMAKDSSGRIQRVATGTGDLKWSHDGTLGGIWDLNGNIGEWCTGLRLVNGEVQIIANNDASLPTTDLSASSSAWKCIKASDGSLMTPNGQGTTEGSVKLDFISNKWVYSTNITSSSNSSRRCQFKDVTCDSTIGAAAKLLLQTLALLPDTALTGDGIDATYGGDYMLANNAQAERCSIRGGNWDGGTAAGVFSLNLNAPHSSVGTALGGRSCYTDPTTSAMTLLLDEE